MKKIFFLILFAMVFVMQVKADSWDNLTQSQANKVVSFVEKNPYLFDYCDCCGSDQEVYLIYATNPEIIRCEWDDSQYSVKVTAERIAKMINTPKGLDNYHTESVADAERMQDYIISMNYTFGFDDAQKWAVPLFKLVNYNNEHICVGAVKYPNPKNSGVKIKHAGYETWYKKKLKSKK